MIDYKIIEVPDAKWLTRLRKNNVVALAKDGGFAYVMWEYEDPGPGNICGEIGLMFGDRRQDSWHIRPDGTGINGTQCLLPVLGHVPEEERELKSNDVRYFSREIERLREQIQELRRLVFVGNRYDDIIVERVEIIPVEAAIVPYKKKSN